MNLLPASLAIRCKTTDCQIPATLAERQLIDLRGGASLELDHIVSQIASVADIDLSQLDPTTFEELVRDVLVVSNYFVVEASKVGKDDGIDFIITRDDVLGAVQWFVTVKAYREERVSLAAVRKMVAQLEGAPLGTKGLLVTNGHLTSVSREFLSQVEKEVRVIDGSEFKNMLLQQPKLVARYFPPGGRQ